MNQRTTLESLEIRLWNDLRELPSSMSSLISLQHVDGCSNLVSPGNGPQAVLWLFSTLF
jgi:hypothetical protein